MHRFLSDPRVAAFEPLIGRENVKGTIDGVLSRARSETGSSASFETLCARALAGLEKRAAEGLSGVINATGVLLHTNLGRAPVAAQALAEAVRIGSGYSNLEYDLDAGARGSRYARLSDLLREVTGAQDGIVVNNCAAAVLLILDTFAKGRDVIVARNQLVEIGGGFRLPEVFERSGARLVEAGTTNKVYLRDYETALSAQTALLFRSHQSNFRITGFTHETSARELSELGKRAGIPVVEDLGSGALVDLSAYGLPRERTVQDALAEGVDLVAFSGDKLLGGPQAGIIAGTRAAVARLRNNPLLRALRVDKLTLAVLGATLRLYLSPDTLAQIPFYRMLGASVESLERRAARYAQAVPGAEPAATTAYVGGGSIAEHAFASAGIRVKDPSGAIALRLRRTTPPVIGRTQQGYWYADLRTIAPEDDDTVIALLRG